MTNCISEMLYNDLKAQRDQLEYCKEVDNIQFQAIDDLNKLLHDKKIEMVINSIIIIYNFTSDKTHLFHIF